MGSVSISVKYHSCPDKVSVHRFARQGIGPVLHLNNSSGVSGKTRRILHTVRQLICTWNLYFDLAGNRYPRGEVAIERVDGGEPGLDESTSLVKTQRGITFQHENGRTRVHDDYGSGNGGFVTRIIRNRIGTVVGLRRIPHGAGNRYDGGEVSINVVICRKAGINPVCSRLMHHFGFTQ